MEWLLQNPLALWLVVAGILLAFEVGTGSGWLLWPTGSAVLTGLAASVFQIDLQMQLVIFARTAVVGGDINDNMAQLAGLEGVAIETFQAGEGRVTVEGQEWAAELEGDGTLIAGARIVVVDVGGSRLTVRAR